MFDILRNKPSKTNAISHKTCSMVFVVFLLASRLFLKKQIRRKHKLFKVDLNVDKSFRDGGQIQNV